MRLLLLMFAVVFFQDTAVPFKPKEEYEIKMDFSFKQRPQKDPNTVKLDEPVHNRPSGPLPYLFLNVRALKLAPEEVRVRVVQNFEKVVLQRKVDLNTVLKLDLGFTDDIKDRVDAYEYTIFFLNDKKEPLSKVVIFFAEDGTYMVNGEKRGKL